LRRVEARSWSDLVDSRQKRVALGIIVEVEASETLNDMAALAEHRRVLITVRTYPTPAKKGVEVSCTAGITQQGEWIRMFPLPYRRLASHQRFTKYQWIELNVTKARGDSRPESYTPDLDSIEIIGSVPTNNKWQMRKELLAPVISHCLCCLRTRREELGYPTLGFFKPGSIRRLLVDKDDPNWTPEQLAKLRQRLLFEPSPAQELEKIPYSFKYEFRCDHGECGGHSLSCTDWELGESYRKWRDQYGPDWLIKFRQMYERDMIETKNTHFFVGTLHGHPGTWIIVGLFYPPK
jgi:hypothetical protein